MKTLSIDIETYSSEDLARCGVYKYAEAPDFEILLFGYAIDGGEVRVVDVASGESIPQDVLDALTDDTVIKYAFNANFERVCLSQYLKKRSVFLSKLSVRHSSAEDARFLNPMGWRCTMVWSAYLGLPLSLAGVGAVLGLDRQKLHEGKDLIRFFCRPCVSNINGGGRTRNLPRHDRQKWEAFKRYNARDVEVEIALQKRLGRYPVPDAVWAQYQQDQAINDRGIALDITLVNNAIQMDALSRQELTAAIQKLTDLDNPNSVQQMKTWLADKGMETDSLGKKQVADMLKTCPPELREVLMLRQRLAKSSVKKYLAMKNAVCADGRARGMFMFYGANRTGRFSGRLIQLQNLPQNHLPDLDLARQLVRSGDYEGVKMLYDDVPDTLSQLIRTAFVPQEGCKLIVSDFAAIEARVIAWLSGEKWRQKVFIDGGDIYCASASAMFHVPVVKHGVNGHLRQKGKVAELALGYGGSVGALKAMGALDMGLAEEELKPLVTMWRESNPNIVRLWWDVDQAVMQAVEDKSVTRTHDLVFECSHGMLFITLPSGRRLSYVKPQLATNQFGGTSVTYMGINAAKKWDRLESYGPKFVENIVQAIARDILCYAMHTLRCSRIVAHVHDELIIECSPDVSLDTMCEQMGQTPPWAPGLILRADGDEMAYYQKA